jgi:hypothetical protein
MAGGNGKRRADDFYPTPPEATVALLRAEAHYLGKYPSVWEPACGDGAIAKLLPGHVVATDLVDRGYGAQADFLKSPRLADAIVTNPPFKLAGDFIDHAWFLDVGYMALLLKAQYWHANARVGLWRLCPPTVEYKLTWRLDFTNRGAPTMDCSWFVWDRERGPTKRIELLEKPKK